eukprot:119675_1
MLLNLLLIFLNHYLIDLEILNNMLHHSLLLILNDLNHPMLVLILMYNASLSITIIRQHFQLIDEQRQFDQIQNYQVEIIDQIQQPMQNLPVCDAHIINLPSCDAVTILSLSRPQCNAYF